MRNTKKIISLLAMLLLAVGLTGCGSSSSGNTGIWIAVTVMVFIAVFSATSGVVYLVLQRGLPPEKPRSRVVRTPDYDYDDKKILEDMKQICQERGIYEYAGII